MWYVFPQAAGLGSSAMSRRYAITSVEEAAAYLDDPVLGSDYGQMVDAVWHHVVERAGAVHDLFGSPDDAQLVASLTLFAGVGRTRQPQRSRLVERADDILAAAASQGLGPCETTLAFLQRGDSRSDVLGR